MIKPRVPTPTQLRLGHAADEAHIRYQQESESTERGREASRLSHEAHPLSNGRRHEEAHALYERALSLFGADDDSAAAAAACYDLAESFKRRAAAVRLENLMEAKRLFERALASPARQRDVLRHAMTHDALGQTYRQLAGVMTENGQRADLKREAVRHYVRACSLVEDRPGLGWKGAAEYYNNLGNALKQLGQGKDAVDAYEHALGFSLFWRECWADRQRPEVVPGLEPEWHLQLDLNLGLALVSEGGKRQRRRGWKLIDKVVDAGVPPLDQQARLAAAAIQHKSPAGAERMRRYLRDVDSSRISNDQQFELARMLLHVGESERARLVCAQGMDAGMKSRQSAVADHSADHAAAQAQRFARLAAGSFVDGGQPVDAFLALENTSGLRYHDSIAGYSWAPTDPVSTRLSEQIGHHAALAKELDELASRVSSSHVDPGEGLETWASPWEAESADGVDDATLAFIHELRAAAEEARRAPSPAVSLRRRAQRHIVENQRLYAILRREYPESNQRQHTWGRSLDGARLQRVLDEHSSRVLLRLHWAEDLLAVSVWLEDGELAGAGARLQLPDGATPLLLRMATAAEDVDPDEVASLLAQLDLSSVLPSSTTHDHLVVMPSLFASCVPWSAAGPPGRTVLDRFAAVSWLPILTPLMMRQAARPPRTGALVVTPGSAAGAAQTHFHSVAFAEPQDGEERLDGVAATIERVGERAATADVVSLYAHGEHGGVLEGGLQLYDGVLSLESLGTAFAGCERVELWACRTAVNLPTDPLIPYVDDAFGTDVAFHNGGARSTIAALWKVPDFVTGHIVRKYRRCLAAGEDAPTALASAQRWWRDEALAVVEEELRSKPEQLALEAIARRLGGPSSGLESPLGPMPAGAPAPRAAIEAALRRWSLPTAWAGYRFLGVCNHRPQGAWKADLDRALTDDEQARLDALLQEPVAERVDPDDVWDEHIATVRAEVDKAGPTPDQALRMARLFGTRRKSRRDHNLLRGLAWLHEALTTPALSANDRQRLATDAAWLWMELARGEQSEERLRTSSLRSQLHVLRLEALLPGVAHADRVVLGTWAERLRSPLQRPEDATRQIRKHWDAIRSALDEAAPSTYEGQRLRAGAAALLLGTHDASFARHELTRWDAEAGEVTGLVEPAAAWELVCVAAELLQRGGEERLPPASWLLSHRERVRRLRVLNQRAGRSGAPEDHLMLGEAQNDDIDLIESDFWGFPADDATPFWTSTGSPGRAWFEVMGGYISATVEQGKATAAAHTLASLNMGADLRIGPLNMIGRGSTEQEAFAERLPWWPAWGMHHLLTALDDASAVFVPSVSEDGLRLHDADPFSEPVATLLAPSPDDLAAPTAWQLAAMVEHWSDHQSRTAAFATERLIADLESRARDSWRMLVDIVRNQVPDQMGGDTEAHQNAAKFLELYQPPRVLQEAEEAAREAAKGSVAVGLALGGKHELVLVASWEKDGRPTQRLWRGEPGSALVAMEHLAKLVGAHPDDFENRVLPMKASFTPRQDLWRDLDRLFGPGLAAVLSDSVGDPAPHLTVLAPGPLRSLPWGGLTLRGKPLSEAFGSIVLLPHLGFEKTHRLRRLASGKGERYCALSTDLDGATDFGAAIIESLRQLYGVRVTGEPQGTVRDTKVVEVEALEAHRQELEFVRFYGTRCPHTMNRTTEALRLKGGRELSCRNLVGSLLPRTRQVELWAATGSVGEAGGIRAQRGDVMPALVQSFLQQGAAGVLDLAWPIPDLVKALLCENFAFLQANHDMPGPLALGWAIRQTRGLLEWWASFRDDFDSLEAAMVALNWARRDRYEKCGIDVQVAGVKTLPIPDLPLETSLQAWLDHILDPTHLAAPRWWGL